VAATRADRGEGQTLSGEGDAVETSVSLLERLSARPTDLDWTRLFDLYLPLLRSWALRAGLDDADADDLVQDTLTVVVREVASFDRGRPGAFRSWLRVILTNRLRDFFRSRRNRPVATGGSDFLERLDQLESPDSELSRLWDVEHDRRVANKVMKIVQNDVEAETWQAFRRQVIEGVSAADVAVELGLSPNAVLIAKCRVLKRLRAELAGLVDC
jgi:RNA polymerase sigma-70 factor (ECF subfamily)